MDEAEGLLAEALRAAQNGDEAGFRVMYRELQPRLIRYLSAIVGEDADDVASEAWLQIARDLATFRGDWDAFRGWAVTIARHRALDHLRAMRRRPSVPLPVDLFADVASGQDTATDAVDTLSTEAAIAMIATLPRDQAEAVLLRTVIGLDAKSAAAVLGKRAGAVRSAAHRGLRQLARELDRTELPATPRRHPIPFGGAGRRA
jgi:RNA polymerase sigma-70 factor (ECF subfamily)